MALRLVGVSFAGLVLGLGCAGILGIEEAECSDEFGGCPGFSDLPDGSAGDGDEDGSTTGDEDGSTTDEDGSAGDGDEDGSFVGEPDGSGDGDEDGSVLTEGPDGSGSVTPVDPVELCDQYCTTIMGNCTEPADQQYPSHGFCMNVCAHFPVGDPSDTQGNNIYCRLLRAENAGSSETAANCQVAGPGGDGVCGDSTCDNVCDFAIDICPDEFTSRSSCFNACEALDDVGTYNESFDTGLDVQCRVYHVNAAAGDANVHCPHVGGAGPCSQARPTPL